MNLLVTQLTEPKFDYLMTLMNHCCHEDCFTVLFASQSGGASSLQNRTILAVKWFARECFFFSHCFVASCSHFQFCWSDLFPFSIFLFLKFSQSLFWTRSCSNENGYNKQSHFHSHQFQIPNKHCSFGEFTFCTFYSRIKSSFSKNKTTNFHQIESFVERAKIETFKNIKHATEVLIKVDQKQHAFGLDELLDGLANNQPFSVSIPEASTNRQKIPDNLLSGMCVLVVVFWFLFSQ